MQTVFGFDTLGSDLPQSTLCIGVFDGMHLGHQAIVRETVRRARFAGRHSIAMTFDRNPLSVIAPQHCPQAISTTDQNLAKIRHSGVDVAIVATFDDNFSKLTADEFFEEYITGKLHAAEMVVGHDFAFGHERQGTTEWLAQRIETHVHPPLELQGARISSSLIRDLVRTGHVAEADRMLGGSYALGGVVVRGRRLGTELGVPTANLAPLFNQVVPAPGIYAGRSIIDGTAYPAAISIGFRPAIPGAGFAIEAHFIDYAGGDLYGRSITVEFVERLRDEQNFDSMTALKQQMNVDIEQARTVLVHHG